MQIGKLGQVAHPLLSWFVICCCIAITMVLYVTQKADAVADSLNNTFVANTTISSQ